MIQVYNPNNTDFNKNGDMVIQPSVAELSIELNGIANIEIELSFDEYGRWEYVVKDSIIRCHTPWDKDKGQLFRVYETEKDMDRYKVYGKHIIADLMTTTAKDLNNEDVMIVATGQTNGQGAITKLLVNTGFIGHSNITKLDSVRWERKLITEALLSDDENSFVKRWGGELFYNNFDLYMNTKIGGNYGVKISYGKNLDSITENINRDGVITRIIPIGANGIRLTGLTPWVDSINISKYPKPLEKVIEFNNVKVKENPEDEEGFATIELARAELIRLSKLMFTQENIDTPIVNIKTSMVDISQTLEYKSMGYSGLEEVNLGDTVICSHYKLGIETEARCIGYKWNILTQRMIDIEIGDVTKNFFDKQNDMSNAVSKILDGDRVKADKLAGTISALQTRFKAQRSIAQPQEIRAILFEDSVVESPSFGAMCLGSMGFEIASKRTTDNKDWDWRTFGSGAGFTADEINVGTLSAILIKSLDGSCSINLSTGVVAFAKGIIKGDGLNIDLGTGKVAFAKGLISGSNSSWNLDTGIINFNKGKIQGLNSSWDLDTGVFISSGRDYNGSLANLKISNGGIDSNEFMRISSEKYLMLTQRINGVVGGEVSVWDGGVSASGNAVVLGQYNGHISAFGDSTFYQSLHINGNLSVSGNKQCLQTTKNYGQVPFYANEDINSLLTKTPVEEIIETIFYEETEKYKAIVKIDFLTKECINTDIDYNVWLSKLGEGDLWVANTYPSYFVVESDRPVRFKYKIEGRRRSFEDRTIENYLKKFYKEI